MAENWKEWEIEEADNLKKIDVFIINGHSKHCACRLVWGDGECECGKGIDKKATHKVSFWGVKCYLNDETRDLWGVNKFYESLISLATWFHNTMSDISFFINPEWEQPGFRFKVIEEYGKSGREK